ncbi:MAG: hypothetical protein M1548_04385 [Actinobacteria bacterium]|nr:hypothetical protein [Actinomycetota bacterium]
MGWSLKRWSRVAFPLVIILVSAIVIGIVIARPFSRPQRELYETARSSELARIVQNEIGGKKLLESITGQEAMEATRRLHKGQVRPAADAVIASYEEEVSIWLTRYENKSIADEQLEKMKQAMSRFGGGFEQLSTEKIGGVEVFVTRPRGKVQFFWRRGDVTAYIIPGTLGQSDIERLVKEVNEQVDGLPPVVILNTAGGAK